MSARTSRKSGMSQDIRSFLATSKPIAHRNSKAAKEGERILLGSKQAQGPGSFSSPLMKKQKCQQGSDGEELRQSTIFQVLSQKECTSSPQEAIQPPALALPAPEASSKENLKGSAPEADFKAKNASTARKRRMSGESSDSSDQAPAREPPKLLTTGPVAFKGVSAGLESEPAFRKFAPLVQIKSKSSLELPQSHQKLLRLFIATETVLNYLKSKDSTAILHKILNSFDVGLFAQMVHVYPEAYKLSPVSVLISENQVNSLAIEFPSDPVADRFVASLDKAASPPTPSAGARQKGELTQLKSSAMEAVKKFVDQSTVRRAEFQKRLELRVELAHSAFLKENHLEWQLDPVQPRWHPDFVLENVPPVAQAELPIKKTVSYLEALKRRTSLFNKSPAKDPASCSAGSPAEDQSRTATPPASPAPSVDKDGKPISRAQALLERASSVRAKQRAKEADALANPKESQESIKKRGMLSRIRPIASSLLMHANANGKTVLGVPEAIAHLQLSFPNYFLTSGE
ncbi:hypothetical protein HDU91_001477 [Kappamyces sp. JEL0680]|nr:hypothetical protein HDU91_001477 [Kappamyces sp. JEL0680]